MVECDNLVKIYKTDEIEVMALQGLDAKIEKGELMAIIGNSGSGKSTFLNMIGGLDRPTAGKLYVDGLDLFKLSEKELVLYKRSTVGFVWQNNARNLISYLPAWQNVQMPMLLTGKSGGKERAVELLDMVGLKDRKDNRLSELSGGEQQRVAIAIALANEPKLLLADEPTGSVDPQTSAYIFETFRRLNRETGLTIIIVTHDMSVAGKVSRIANIRDGKISSERIMRNDYLERLERLGTFGADPTGGQESHEEYAVLDRSGRVQIPAEFLQELDLSGNRVKMELKDGRVVITPPDKDAGRGS
ncbi:MAG: ATP-binding cassette domain-containing protein [Clostridiales bacterium]|nr:ATP-binding cassette domain-containing protein [Clostridiales bacterium]